MGARVYHVAIMDVQPAQALIFDMDGLLFDTERLYFEATQQVVGPYGHTVKLETYGDWIGRHVPLAEIAATFPCPLPPEELLERMSVEFRRRCDEDLTLVPGALEFLDGVARDFPKAIASSTQLPTIDSHLRQMGLLERFGVRVSARDVPRGKPAPDVFLEAARQLGVEPSACVVFEDSPHGVRGAAAAGMRAVAVPSDFTRHIPFPGATLTVRRLDEVTAGWLALAG